MKFKRFRLLQSVFLVFAISASTVTSAKVIDRIVAIVNDQIITLSDVNSYQANLKNGGLVDDALMKMTNPKKLLTDRKALLDHMVDEKIIDSDVKKKNLQVTIERVEEEIRNLMKRNGINREQLKQVLKNRGVSMAQYQDFIKTTLERQALIQREVTSKIRISDEDIASYYLSKNGNSGNQTFQYTLAHILMNPRKGGDKAAKSRAQDVYRKLKEGASFEKLAEQYSEDPNFTKGGLLGTFTGNELTPEIAGAIKKVSAGDYSKVVNTKFGYEIFKVVKRTLIDDPRMNAEKDEIRSQLFSQAFKRQFQAWLAQQKQDSFIRINKT